MGTMYVRLAKDWKEHFILYASSAIIVSTCLGGVAVLSIFQHGSGLPQMIQLFVVVALCMTVLSSILTVQKPKIVLNAIIASLSICSVIAALNLLF